MAGITKQLSELGKMKNQVDANIEEIKQKHESIVDRLQDKIGNVTQEEEKQSKINRLFKKLISMYEQKYLRVKFANDSFQNDF